MEIQGKGKTIMKNNMQCGHTIPDFKNYYQPIKIKKNKAGNRTLRQRE